MAQEKGTLYLVGTPIGNLADISRRAIETLGAVQLVACEDTRHTRILLDRVGVSTRVTSLPAFDEKRRAAGLVDRLVAGENVALVTDAGMPGISDPGSEVVRLAVEAGVRVVPIPGASAPLAALAASGLPTERFTFFGFLPRKGGTRKEALEELRASTGTLLLFESPRRLGETLLDLREALGDRRACVARELTKLHEELVRGTLSELAEHFSGEVLGEITLVIEGAPRAAPSTEADVDGLLRGRLAAGASVKDASREVAEALGLAKKDVYRRALELASEER
ncbi:16S rRNA (cytidine(1402)-2'-O)-methyltransferase [Vulgatibacter incomptus]|uniref:Ribosomal RNA small subunit methyltransferase I n=1 Tax=Vulgatibacter incomptus TaxID=1391653 RepID=A0A0K1PDU1_9BACT|nr:16S rRNA (cytidine(1402)-2'-O)-methyltransferase [Vulgatibacter incomptus]AKU91279.1 rRNA small subunit methyltransferase I [Vulgatibacter incomptus]